MIPLPLTDTAVPATPSAKTAEAAIPPDGEEFAAMFALLTPGAEPQDNAPLLIEGEADPETLIDAEEEVIIAPTEAEPDVTAELVQAELPDQKAPVPIADGEELRARDKPAKVDPVVTGQPNDKAAKTALTTTTTPAPQTPAASVTGQTSLAQTVMEGRMPVAETQQPVRQTATAKVEQVLQPAAKVPPEKAPEMPTTASQPASTRPKTEITAVVPVEEMADIPEETPREVKARHRDAPLPEIRTATPLQQQPSQPAIMAPQAIVAGSKETAATVALGGGEPLVETVLGASPTERATTSQMPTAIAAPTTAGAETARHAANQIAVAISNQPGRATEISLNPEELGRVRLSMTAVDATITLHVLAERQETTDLLRRHIDALAQEFRDLGYDNISFSFDGDNQNGTEGEQQDANLMAQPDADTVETNRSNTGLPTGGLDLRL